MFYLNLLLTDGVLKMETLRDKVITSTWSRADALKVRVDDPTTTQPLVSIDFPVMSDEVFVWDTMPLRKLDGNIVSVNGWSVILTLTAVREPQKYLYKDGNYDIDRDWNDRHGRAHICYWYSKDSKNWIFGGRVMPEGVSPTTREWAGTPILLNENGDIDLYYTCVTPNATIAKVKGKITADDNGVSLHDFEKVEQLFSADGVLYQTEAQNPYWGFRDPCPFIDPASGRLFMVFEGNIGGDRGSHVITTDNMGDVPPGFSEVGGARFQTGCIGIAVAKDLTGDDWELLPPLISAVGVNDQTERPHFVFKDGMYYLFTISHSFTYADGLSGPDGVYGFASESLFGPYSPLNGSGLVLGNPSSQPYQTYSHYVMPNGLVTSFIDTIPNKGSDYQGAYRVGGTEAPTVQIKIKGLQTFLIKEFDHGFIPPTENMTIR